MGERRRPLIVITIAPNASRNGSPSPYFTLTLNLALTFTTLTLTFTSLLALLAVVHPRPHRSPLQRRQQQDPGH